MDNFLYTEKRVFSRYEAWNDILLNVNWEDKETMIKGKVYTIKAGQSLLSMDSWAKRWNWNKSAVRRFFKLLQERSMISLVSDNISTQLTVCNWATYQVERNADETPKKRRRNANDTQTTPIKEEEEYKEDKKVFVIPSVIDINAYCIERKNDVNAQRFFDYYESKGWLVGKVKMKDWKAAVRTWEKESKDSPKQPTLTIQEQLEKRKAEMLELFKTQG